MKDRLSGRTHDMLFLPDQPPMPLYRADEAIAVAVEPFFYPTYPEGTGAGRGHGPHYARHGSTEPLSVSRYEGHIIFGVTRYLRPDTILELGTGTGYSTAWLSLAWPKASIITVDNFSEGKAGDQGERAALDFWKALALTNITLYRMPVAELPDDKMSADLIFVDGTIKFGLRAHSCKVRIEHDSASSHISLSTSSRTSVTCGDGVFLEQLRRLVEIFEEHV